MRQLFLVLSFFLIKQYRTNEEITASVVNVIVQDSEEMLGNMSVSKAIEEAVKRELDLVEVAPKANPPVCKIMNYGQFLYQQKKADQKNKKKQKQTEVKTIRLGFRIGEHDIDVREKQARGFLAEGDIVRVVMQFKGREMSHIDFGLDKIKDFAVRLQDVAKIDQEPKRQGYQVVMVLAQKK